MELFWLNNELVNNWGKTLVAAVVITTLFLTYRYFHHLNRHLRYIPTVDCSPIWIYVIFLLYCARKMKQMNHLAFVLQIACAFCIVYSKQRICFCWVAYRPLVFFFKPETVEALLSSNETIDKAKEYGMLHTWLGTGLVTSSGDKWRIRRKLLTSSFHFRILEDFIPIYNEQSKILIEKMRTMTNKEWVDIVPLITMCTLEIICETTMGVRLNAQGFTDSEYVRALHRVGDIIMYRVYRPWLWNDTLFGLFASGRKFKKDVKVLHDFTRKVIKKKKKILLREVQENVQNGEAKSHESGFGENQTHEPKKRSALLELLLEEHLKDKALTEEDIAEEVNTFMFAGHDTIAMAICWTLYNLGVRLDIQEKVSLELDSIFDDDVERPVTSDDMKAMKYLDCVIKESLRLYPPVAFLGRELRQDLQVLDYTVPPGSLCFIFPYMLHRDPDTFPNPEYFDPERFSPENTAGRHPYAYIPFSAGPRNCIGQRFALMELKTVLAHILRNFKVTSLDHRDCVQVTSEMILRNVEPLRMQLTPRCQ